jgi:hypothetical protein
VKDIVRGDVNEGKRAEREGNQKGGSEKEKEEERENQ